MKPQLLRRSSSQGVEVAKPKLTRRSSSQIRLLEAVRRKSENRFANLRQAFRMLDMDSSGGIDREELAAGLNAWGLCLMPHQIDRLMDAIDKRGDGHVAFAEFCDAIEPRPPPLKARPVQCSPAFELLPLLKSDHAATSQAMAGYVQQISDRVHAKSKQLAKAFRSFDLDKDGRLSLHELLAAVRCFNLLIPREHVEQIFHQCDRDGNGSVDYEEFALLFKRRDALGN